MDEIVATAIKNAADLIRAGDMDAARPLLTEVLKRNDQIEQAWFLLSYTLADEEKSRYALEQALKINPEFERAKNRLAKIKGRQTKAGARDADLPDVSSPPGWEVTSKTKPLPYLEDMDLPVDANDVNSDTSPFYDSAFIDDDEDEAEVEKNRRGLRNRLILATVGLAIIAALLYVGQQLSFSRPSNGAAGLVSTSTLSQGFRTLPPTWTPEVSATIELTPIPTSTPGPGSNIPEVDDATLLLLEDTQEQVAELRGLQNTSAIDNFFIAGEELSPLLADFFQTEQFIRQTERLSKLYSALGLVPPDYSLNEYELARHYDAFGAFYAPEFQSIYLQGDDLSGISSYAYAYAFNQALINIAFGLDTSLESGNCASNPDFCLALYALLKADAKLLADQWLGEYGTDLLRAELLNFEAQPIFAEDNNLPLYLLRQSEFSLNQASAFAATAYEEGGWTLIDELYSTRALTSKLILHPEILADESEAPLFGEPDLSVLLPDSWQLIAQGSLGEWITGEWLSSGINVAARLLFDEAASAVAGWQGDSFQLYGSDDGDFLMALIWQWDNQQNRVEFELAANRYLQEKYPEMSDSIAETPCRSNELQSACLLSNETQTLLVISTQSNLLSAAIPLYTDFQ